MPAAEGALASSGCTTASDDPAVTGPTPDDPARTGRRTITSGGVERSYLLTRPTGAVPGVPSPVILSFHGFGSTAEEFSSLTQLPERGAAAGFTVVVPEGAGHTWQFTGDGTDAAFVDAVLDDVAATTCVDRHRVTASGFSAGAAFTIAYACAHPDRVSAIVTVAVDFQLGCKRPLPILAFHGTADPAVPYTDGAIGLSLPGAKVRGTENNLGDWAALDRCDRSATVETVGPEVVRHTWTGCADGTEVGLYAVQGGGHSWPGADPTRSVGLTTQEISATDLALAFAARHRGV